HYLHHQGSTDAAESMKLPGSTIRLISVPRRFGIEAPHTCPAHLRHICKRIKLPLFRVPGCSPFTNCAIFKRRFTGGRIS
ncbi:MAG TPA: hypothetical protein VFA48_08290, partial [Gammaproteobacteria bacterium]|nr:hypothetical protein [Gammaproteobacteria bacterium]